MDIDCIQYDNSEEIEYRQHKVNEEFEKIYKTKFKDKGNKETYTD